MNLLHYKYITEVLFKHNLKVITVFLIINTANAISYREDIVGI